MDLIIQNPWWRNKQEIENDSKVSEALKKEKKVLYQLVDNKNRIILGPRQVGKTSMIKLIIYDLIIKKGINPLNICYFSCEPLVNKNDIIEVIKEFDKISDGKHKYIFLDEVTQINEWEYAIKFIIETNLSKDKTLIVTGSNALLLKQGTEKLPGRNIKTELFLPLSFMEFLEKFSSQELKETLKNKENFEKVKKSKFSKKNFAEISFRNRTYAKFSKEKELNPEKLHSLSVKLSIFSDEIEKWFNIYLKTGGYLKAIYEYLENKKISEDTYEIYTKWILGDINKLGKKENTLKSVIIGLIKAYSNKFSLHSLARETEIKSHLTVSDYLDILQSLLVTNQLYQLDINKKMPLFRKEKKNYFLDPLIYNVSKGWTKGKFIDYSEDNKDNLIEGIVCEALARIVRIGLDTSSNLWFYCNKKETDFAMKQNNSLIGIELKYQNKVNKSDFNNFYLFKKRILLSKKQLSYDREDNFLIIPVHLFLSII